MRIDPHVRHVCRVLPCVRRVPLLGVCSAFANVEVAETTKSEIGQDGRNWLDDLASLPQLDELDHVLLDTSTHIHIELH